MAKKVIEWPDRFESQVMKKKVAKYITCHPWEIEEYIFKYVLRRFKHPDYDPVKLVVDVFKTLCNRGLLIKEDVWSSGAGYPVLTDTNLREIKKYLSPKVKIIIRHELHSGDYGEEFVSWTKLFPLEKSKLLGQQFRKSAPRFTRSGLAKASDVGEEHLISLYRMKTGIMGDKAVRFLYTTDDPHTIWFDDKDKDDHVRIKVIGAEEASKFLRDRIKP